MATLVDTQLGKKSFVGSKCCRHLVSIYEKVELDVSTVMAFWERRYWS